MKKILLLVVVGLTLVPQAAFAANLPLFNPDFTIVPEACHSCPCSFAGTLQLVQNVMNVMISFGVLIIILVIVMAGFQFLMSASNPHGKEQAKGTFVKAIIGFLVVISAWLVVDFIMKTLYEPDTEIDGKRFGPWNEIIRSDDANMCIEETGGVPIIDAGTIGGIVGGTNPGGTSGANCPAADPSGMEQFPSSVVSGDAESAKPEIVRSFLAMREAALEDNIDLKVTDGYRPESEQVALWNQNCGSGRCRVDTAKPCSLGGSGSNHNSGEAIDIAVGCRNGNRNCNTATYRWLRENAGQWGFRNNLPSDPVHWSLTGR